MIDADKTKAIISTDAKPTDDDIASVQRETEIEKVWAAQIPAFTSEEVLAEAVVDGEAVKIEVDPNFVPIMRLRNPELHMTYPPYLRPFAADALHAITGEWRQRASQAGVNPRLRLALSSLSRTVDYQEALVAAGKLAVHDSPHTHGIAFDIPAAECYLEIDGEFVSLNPRGDMSHYQTDFQRLDAQLPQVKRGDYARDFDPRVTSILKSILDERQARGELHYIYEFQGTNNETFHICIKPPE